MNYNFNLTCENCHNDNIVEDHAEGNYLCKKCGLVVDQIFSTQPSRSMNCYNGPHYELYEEDDHTWELAYRTMNHISSLLNMPRKVLETACQQFHKVRDGMDNFHGYNVEDIAATVMYISVGLCKKPYSLSQICLVNGSEKSKIESLFFKISQYTDKNENPEKYYTQMCHAVCKKLGLENQETQKADKIFNNIIQNQWLSGKPTTSIAVAIYGAVGDKKENNSELIGKIGKELGKATNTIKENYEKIQQKIIRIC